MQWSSLTPVISGKISAPTPLFLVNLKNEKRYANCAGEEVRGKKQKTLEGTYAVETKDGYTIAKPTATPYIITQSGLRDRMGCCICSSLLMQA